MLAHSMIYSGLGWIFRGDLHQHLTDIGSTQGCFTSIVNHHQVFGAKSRCHTHPLTTLSSDEFSSKSVWINVENLRGGIHIIVWQDKKGPHPCSWGLLLMLSIHFLEIPEGLGDESFCPKENFVGIEWRRTMVDREDEAACPEGTVGKSTLVVSKWLNTFIAC